MKHVKKSGPQQDWEIRSAALDKKFQELKRRTEIKERYGVFTQKMFEELLEELRIRLRSDIRKDLESVHEKLDWLVGAYRKFDEEYALIVNKLSNVDERVDDLEKQKVSVVQ